MDDGTLRLPEIVEDEEVLTAAEVVSQMKNAWQSEAAVPCLLPHRMDLVECLLDQIDGMDENLQRCSNKGQLKVSLHRLELHRISYLVNHYLRRRLQKIELNPHMALRQDEERIKERKQVLLSDSERSFASRCSSAGDQLMHKLFCQHIPPSVGRLPVPREDLSLHRIFMRVNAENLEEVAIPDMEDSAAEVMVRMEFGSVHLIPLQPIISLVEDGSVQPL